MKPIALVGLLLLIPAALGHGAPDPSETLTRLLHDWNDDCGSEGINDCRSSHDLIALDLQETYDGRDKVVLRLTMDKAGKYPVQDVVTISGKTFTLSTSDDRSFSVTGGSASGATSIGDGSRFYVDITVDRSTFGATGTQLKGFKVESKVGGQVGDYMPGGCNNSLANCPPGDTSTAFERTAGYTLRGPSYYATVTGPASIGAKVGEPETVNLQVRNLLRQTTQDITLNVEAGNADAGFHVGADAAGGSYASSVSLAVTGSSTTNVHLRVGADSATAGKARITWTTNDGGHGTLEIPYQVSASGTPPPAATSSTTKSSPGPAVGLLAILGLATYMVRRN